MYDYTIYPDNNTEVFKDACKQIERYFPHWHKEEMLIDVDGSMLQSYTLGESRIIVRNSYYLGAVYITSDIELSKDLIEINSFEEEKNEVSYWLCIQR